MKFIIILTAGARYESETLAESKVSAVRHRKKGGGGGVKKTLSFSFSAFEH